VTSTDPGRRARARDAAAAAAQYGLLFGFAAVAAAISAHGLTGFARTSMGLRGPWPYLLWGALDGAAGLCAVLLMRRAARGEPALAPRLAVWGLVAASSAFNWTHAPDHPAAREAFALMPLIAAVLFEFSLRETRHAARPAGRRPASLQWLHPVERIRVQLQLAADDTMPAGAATRRVRAGHAARRLYQLRRILEASERGPRPGRRRVRRAERRAQAALTRTAFADNTMAADVLRHVQILTLARTLARLDYATPDGARAALAALITPAVADRPLASLATVTRRPGMFPGRGAANGHPAGPGPDGTPAVASPGQPGENGLAARVRSPVAPPSAAPPHGQPETGIGRPGDHDGPLIAAAARIVADARRRGARLSQADLAGQLRARGHSVANDRLRWLSAASGLEPGKSPR
jgi:hypothetical protein